MKCPFRLQKDIKLDTFDNHSKGHVYVNEEFAPCHGDDCPFFYMDCHDVEKCARCDGGEEEL